MIANYEIAETEAYYKVAVDMPGIACKKPDASVVSSRPIGRWM